MKRVDLEYGHGVLTVDLPDSTDVFVAGDTASDPPALEDVYEATRQSVLQPLGMPPIADLVGPGARVTISFPDRVKGGYQPDSHRKTSIPIIVEACLEAGVRKQDITLICAIGLHRKNTDDEIRQILGEKMYQEFMPTGQIVNHDAEDWDNLLDLGHDEQGNRVIVNRAVVNSELAVLIGHVMGNPYGGYSGGYKMAATGITHWKSIAAHHVPGVMHRHDFVPASSHSLMRERMDSIGRYIERCMGRKFFMCDAVLDSQQRQIAIFSGYGNDIQPLTWHAADHRTYIPWARQKYDVMVFGMPQNFHYGDGHGTNPILMLQAIAANIIRHRRVMNGKFVVVCASLCNGYFHDEEFPGYRELYELFQTDYHHTLPSLAKFGDYYSSRRELIDRYRFGYGYHPFHAFSMISCGHIAHRESAAIYIVGAQHPGYARGMEMKTRATFEEALHDARKIVGPSPKILALPRVFKIPGVHLMMADDPLPRRLVDQ